MAQIRSIYVAARTGILLFSTDYVKSNKSPHSVIGLITAFNDLANRAIGTNVQYLLMSNVAITIAQSEPNGTKVIVFHDADYYRQVAHHVAIEILRAFCSRFEGAARTQIDSSAFRHFYSNIGPAVRAAPNAIMRSMITSLRGVVQFAVVWYEQDPIFTHPSNAPVTSVAANLQGLLIALQDVSSLTSDGLRDLTVNFGEAIVHVAVFGAATVLLQVQASLYSQQVIAQIKEGMNMVRLCFKTGEDIAA